MWWQASVVMKRRIRQMLRMWKLTDLQIVFIWEYIVRESSKVTPRFLTWDVIVKITIREMDSLVRVCIMCTNRWHTNVPCSVVDDVMGCHCHDGYQGDGVTCMGRYYSVPTTGVPYNATLMHQNVFSRWLNLVVNSTFFSLDAVWKIMFNMSFSWYMHAKNVYPHTCIKIMR